MPDTSTATDDKRRFLFGKWQVCLDQFAVLSEVVRYDSSRIKRDKLGEWQDEFDTMMESLKAIKKETIMYMIENAGVEK